MQNSLAYRFKYIENIITQLTPHSFMDYIAKSKIEKFLFNTHSSGSIIYLTCNYIVVPIAQCIAVQSCWINAASLMCVTIKNLFRQRLLENIERWVTAFFLHTVALWGCVNARDCGDLFEIPSYYDSVFILYMYFLNSMTKTISNPSLLDIMMYWSKCRNLFN